MPVTGMCQDCLTGRPGFRQCSCDLVKHESELDQIERVHNMNYRDHQLNI